MGVYLSSPVTEKESINKECPEQGFCYGASSMQGWRTTQEDAHNCIPVYDEKTGTSFFAVYDGHGGSEVAKYCERHFPNFLKALIRSQVNFENVPTEFIQSVFVAFDTHLTEDTVIKELKTLAGKEDDLDEEEDEDLVGRTETDLLKEEAGMPLEKVLAQYNDGEPKPGADSESGGGASSSSSAASSSATGSKDTPAESQAGSNVSTNNNCASGGSGSGSSGGAAVEAGGSSGSGSASGVRSSKAKASADMAKTGADPDSDDDDDDDEEDEEDAWEDLSDESDDDDDDEEAEADNDIPMMDTSDEEPGSDSGCTACVLLKQGRRLIVANAGDSRCVLSRAGQAVELSWDHKPEDEPERTRIEAAGGKVTSDGRVNGGLNLSRAIGDHVYKRNTKLSSREQMITALPDVHTEQLRDEDQFIVLACDGIWNSLSSQEVVDYVSARLKNPEKRKRPALICEELFDHCLASDTYGDGTGCDNMTCIIIVLDDLHSLESNGERESTATGVDSNGGEKSAGSDKKQSTDNNANSSCEDQTADKNDSTTVHKNAESAGNDSGEEKTAAQTKRCADDVEAGDKKRLKLEENVV